MAESAGIGLSCRFMTMAMAGPRIDSNPRYGLQGILDIGADFG
jgi:hypothetical protein